MAALPLHVQIQYNTPVLRCPRCDQPNDEASRFCKHCGAPVDSGASEADFNDDTLIIRLLDERPDEAVDRRARLWLLDPAGEHVAQVTELVGGVTVMGRQAECAVCLPSSTVSRRHAQVRREGSQYFLQDPQQHQRHAAEPRAGDWGGVAARPGRNRGGDLSVDF